MAAILSRSQCVNTLTSGQTEHICDIRHFFNAKNKHSHFTWSLIFYLYSNWGQIHLNEDVRILLKVVLKFVPRVQINNIPALLQIMAWHWPGDKPLSEPIMVSLLTHIYMCHLASILKLKEQASVRLVSVVEIFNILLCVLWINQN